MANDVPYWSLAVVFGLLAIASAWRARGEYRKMPDYPGRGERVLFSLSLLTLFMLTVAAAGMARISITKP